jgi:CHAT domain-containing protein/Flp pilus assembly protein TadD
MNAMKLSRLVVLAIFALALCWTSLARAESKEADALYPRIIELWRSGKYAEAVPLAQRVLEIYEKQLGRDHPNVAIALNNLAELLGDQGRYAEAEPFYKRALEIEEKATGAEGPNMAHRLDELAVLYARLGRYAEAEPLLKRAVALEEKYPRTQSKYLDHLGVLYTDQGRYAEAETLLQRAVTFGFSDKEPRYDLAMLYYKQGKYADAEPLLKTVLDTEKEARSFYYTDAVQNTLAAIYYKQRRYNEALPLVKTTIANKSAEPRSALPTLYIAQEVKLMPADDAVNDGLEVVQRAAQTAAGQALNALGARFSAGSGRLAQLVRQDQDLAGEAKNLQKDLIAAESREPRDPATEQQTSSRIAAVTKKRGEVQAVMAREFPKYADLSDPQPLSVKAVQLLLADDEAVVVLSLADTKSYIWAITRTAADWKELPVTDGELSKDVANLRQLLDVQSARPFDAQASFALYQKLIAPVEDTLMSKSRLSFVLGGPLSSLPPMVLVTNDPTGKALKDVDWLIRAHAVTVLPSVTSLKVLRGKSAVASTKKPLIGFADPVFDPDPRQLAQNTHIVNDVAAARGLRGTVADLAELKATLPPLPETADELREVAASVHADPADVILGPAATVTQVKKEKLDQFGIVYFATHGLLAGDVADFAKLNAEPALVLSLPERPTEFDDGLLTASEVAQLKLNADWVVLSACNTASADKPGAEALSGLARAFFYAGARSLVVSNWEVDSESAAHLMTDTFAALAADAKLSHGEALQKSMLAMIGDAKRPQWADPKYWAPFVVVGEPAKPAN